MAVAAEQKSLARLETLQAQLQSRVEELQQKQREVWSESVLVLRFTCRLYRISDP